MRSTLKSSFSRTPSVSLPRTTFNRSFGHKTTFDAGYLIPFFIDEALPGDTYQVQTSVFARLSTFIRPIMDNLHLETWFFFVPNRILWRNWKIFQGERENPGDPINFVVPQMISPDLPDAQGYEDLSLADYFGIRTKVPGLSHSALFHRAYNVIWNEYFRNENLQNFAPVNDDDGPDNPFLFELLRRCKRYDYFTSALPSPQSGPSVKLPLSGNAPVSGLGFNYSALSAQIMPKVLPPNSQRHVDSTSDNSIIAGRTDFWDRVYLFNDDSHRIRAKQVSAGSPSSPYSYKPDVYADLSAVTATTINQLRQAFQTQKILERDARCGTRYVEILESRWNITPQDARLNRPEFWHHGRVHASLHPVPQTSETQNDTSSKPKVLSPQGNLAANGVFSHTYSRFSHYVYEHGIVMGLVCLSGDLTYQQGLHRMFSRKTRYDFCMPEFFHIGEQAILNKEIFSVGAKTPQLEAQDEAAFGYQERYAEYRYKPSMVTGKFRSEAAGTLHTWHLAQEFQNLPTLNSKFMQEDPPLDRVISQPDEPHVILDAYFDFKHHRQLPAYGIPGLIDHF